MKRVVKNFEHARKVLFHCCIAFFFFVFCASALGQSSAYQQRPLLLPSPLVQQQLADYEFNTILSHLEALQESDAIRPEQALLDLQAVIDYAKETRQPELELEAATVKILIHNSLSQVPEIERLVNTYLPQAVNASAVLPLSRIYRAMLNVALIKGQPDKRVAIKRQLKQVIQMELPERQKGLALLSLGTSEFFAGQYFSALQLLGRAQEIFVRNDLRLDEDRVLSILAIVNSRLGNERRAIDLQLQIAQRMRQGEKTLNWSVIDFNIASAYFDLGDYPNARIYVARSRQVAEDLADDVGVAYANELMAKIALEELQWESAISLASQAAEVFANSADSEKQADALITLASAYTLRGELDNADAVIAQLEQLQAKLALKKIDIAMLKLRSLHLEKSGQSTQALALFKQYHQEYIEQETSARAAAVDRLMAEFTVDAQQSENRYLTQQNELKQAQIGRQQQQQTILMLGIILVSMVVCAIVLVVVFQWRKNLVMHDLALTDELTGAPNRRACFRAAKLAFNRANAGHYPVVVAVVDLDNFKSINDRFGHEAGDKILKAFAEAVKSVLRDQDTYGRMGGEEWLIVFPHADVAHVNRIFTRLRKAYQLKVSKLGFVEHPLTFSMGAVSSYGIDSSVEGMINRADKLVYQAKAKGRDCLVV